MKISTKIVLSTVFIGILGFGSFTRATYGNQLPSQLLATQQYKSGIKLAEADSPNDRDSSHEDGDTEASDVRRVPITKIHRITHTKHQNIHHQKSHHARRHHTK
ncbi:hypothetical protein [Nostoc punctiforme]|uniref:Uncharacterized protein n=1 Tax=Nostoc punctiforme (strain ATCC 29133 / PCC 73102) TaxID=63737 RepID=B2JBG4_NOSP7|nr:hypothetical protein [Nostoc punctiforme]ACC85268.1 hypothetical protein Npun_BF134 [Nostoc punctiforme PCC 73102]